MADSAEVLLVPKTGFAELLPPGHPVTFSPDEHLPEEDVRGEITPDDLEGLHEGLAPDHLLVVCCLLNAPDQKIVRNTLVELLNGSTDNARQTRFTKLLKDLATGPFGDSLYTRQEKGRSRSYWLQQDGELVEGDAPLLEVYGAEATVTYNKSPEQLAKEEKKRNSLKFTSFDRLSKYLSDNPDEPLKIGSEAQFRMVQAYLKDLHRPNTRSTDSHEATASAIAHPDADLKRIYERCNEALVDYLTWVESEVHVRRGLGAVAVSSGNSVIIADDGESGWQDFANCLGVDPDFFFPERGASTKEAKEVCRGCVVREDCLEFALVRGEKFGIWGGLSERERRRIRRQRSIQRRAEQEAAAAMEAEAAGDPVA